MQDASIFLSFAPRSEGAFDKSDTILWHKDKPSLAASGMAYYLGR